MATKDLEFIKMFSEKYTSKTIERFQHQSSPNKYNTYQLFRELVLANEFDLLEYLLDLVFYYYQLDLDFLKFLIIFQFQNLY
mgnify:CR=1 FL=1